MSSTRGQPVRGVVSGPLIQCAHCSTTWSRDCPPELRRRHDLKCKVALRVVCVCEPSETGLPLCGQEGEITLDEFREDLLHLLHQWQDPETGGLDRFELLVQGVD